MRPYFHNIIQTEYNTKSSQNNILCCLHYSVFWSNACQFSKIVFSRPSIPKSWRTQNEIMHVSQLHLTLLWCGKHECDWLIYLCTTLYLFRIYYSFISPGHMWHLCLVFLPKQDKFITSVQVASISHNTMTKYKC